MRKILTAVAILAMLALANSHTTRAEEGYYYPQATAYPAYDYSQVTPYSYYPQPAGYYYPAGYYPTGYYQVPQPGGYSPNPYASIYTMPQSSGASTNLWFNDLCRQAVRACQNDFAVD